MSFALSSQALEARLSLIRANLGSLDGYIIPTADAHGSEYIANCDKRREFISGFTGSAGTVLITRNEAILWTDSRYTLQARQELNPNVWHIINIFHGPNISTWLTDRFVKPTPVALKNDPMETSTENLRVEEAEFHAFIGCDPSTISYNEWKNYNSYLKMRGIKLVLTDENLVDFIWTDRPARPNNSLITLPPNFTGMFWSEKVRRVCTEMAKVNCDALVVSALDEISWLLNLRGSDIEFNPVFFSYVIVTEDGVHIFMNDNKLRATPGIVDHLTSTKMKTFLYDYTQIGNELKKISQSITGQEKMRFIWCDPRTSISLVNTVPRKVRYLAPSPIERMKMMKTPEEVNGIRRAHIQDAIAVCRYLQYLEEKVDIEQITEVTGAAKLDAFRAEEADFVSLSFPTISGYGPNGAVIHYHAKEETAAVLGRDSLYLVDSGGQYHTGTTDITRTVHLGNPSEEERRNFTLVLKGHINLSRLVFPLGTLGSAIDSFARTALWRSGLDYGHGTGHGVGAFLNVHEGPCGIFSPSSRKLLHEEGLKPNTIITIEPGYYREGSYGIRIENVVLVTGTSADASTPLPEGYLRFEAITFVPIQTRLIMKSLLTNEEIQWVNDYHQLCRQVLTPHLTERNLFNVHDWLLAETQPL